MQKTSKSKKISTEEMEAKATRGEDVTMYFSGKPKVRNGYQKIERVNKNIQRVNVDFTSEMLKELDIAVEQLNISRQAVIKTLIREALDRHYLAKKARKTS